MKSAPFATPYVLPTPSLYWELATVVPFLPIPHLKLLPSIGMYADLGHDSPTLSTFPLLV